MSKVGLSVKLRPPCKRCKIASSPPPPHFQDRITNTLPPSPPSPRLDIIFGGGTYRICTGFAWFTFRWCYISVIRGKLYCQWVRSYWKRNYLNIYWQIQFAWSACMQMLYWESQGPRSQLLLLIRPQIACIVMFVLLVCDFCQTTYSLRHVCSWIFLKKPLINTDSLHINYHFHFFFIITGSRYAMYCSWYSKKSFNNKEVEFE